MRDTIVEGAESRDYFGLTTDKEGKRYLGFSFGQKAAIYMEALLLVEPGAAAAYKARTRPSEPAAGVSQTTLPATDTAASTNAIRAAVGSVAVVRRLTRYFATRDLDPVRAAIEFGQIQKELIGLFTADRATNVSIRIDINAEKSNGFDEATTRAVRENGRVLGVDGRFE